MLVSAPIVGNDKQVALLSLRANVTQQEAFQAFRGSSIGALYRRTFRGPLQRLAAAYVPFRLYRVQYDLGRTHNSRTFGLDQVDGSLDLFEFADDVDTALRLLQEGLMKYHFQAEPETPAMAKSADPDPASLKK